MILFFFSNKLATDLSLKYVLFFYSKVIIFHQYNQKIVCFAFQSIKVVMAGYMRGGTTFLGELFQRNPQAQYWYEPLGGFYTYYYAVKTHAAHGIGLTGGDVR